MTHPRKHAIIGLLALLLIGLSVFLLERERAGVVIASRDIGTTPVTLYERPGATGPAVVIAHGFAGSRQIMQAYSLRLAQAGYRVLAFDFEGHGRNPQPMRGDVTAIDGTTVFLQAETQRVIAAARALPGAPEVALLGHSMATDILVRASIAEQAVGRPIAAVVAISMFSQAVSATEPARLLMISGQGEPALRGFALAALHQIDPAAGEGDLVTTGAGPSAGPSAVARLAVVAPHVEHVGVLYSPTAVAAARDWLDASFGRPATPGPVAPMGLWILVLLSGIVLALHPLEALLPKGPEAPRVATGRFFLATLLPAIVAPLLLPPLYANFMPVLVADYLMLHLALYGGVQLLILGGWRSLFAGRGALPLAAVALLLLWGLGVFGLALDRYAVSFWPTPERLAIIAVLALGTVPFMLADARVTEAGRGRLWRRVFARLALIASLGAAAFRDMDDLMFVLIVMPLFLLFMLVHGLMGRWVARRSGALAAGLGLGLCLAVVLGVSFPLFAR